jgi:hypothetical protein
MSSSAPQAGRNRPLVRQIVLTYTMEGDPEQKEHTLTLSREGTGAVVDGVVWSRRLMDRLGYLDRPGGGCEPVQRRPARPEDGWRRRVAAGGGVDATSDDPGTASFSAAATSADDDGRECVWIHSADCRWIEWCDGWLPE